MRNALVLVLLCIGLTSGFIVSTSAPEAQYLMENISTSIPTRETTVEEDEKMNNTFNDSTRLDMQLKNINQDDIKEDMYKEGLEKNKNLDERSFVLVNERSKQPYMTKSKNNNNNLTQKQAYLNVFREEPRGNVGAHDKKGDNEHNKHKNKINQKNDTERLSHHFIHTISNLESKKTYKAHFIDLLKLALANPLGKDNGTITLVTNTQSKTANTKNFFDQTKENHNQAFNNNKQKAREQIKDRFDNTPFFKSKINVPNLPSLVEIAKEKGLFQLLLEEQGPHQQSINKNVSSSTGHVKSCRKCANAAKLSDQMRSECDCKCGRYIHLKGRAKPAD